MPRTLPRTVDVRSSRTTNMSFTLSRSLLNQPPIEANSKVIRLQSTDNSSSSVHRQQSVAPLGLQTNTGLNLLRLCGQRDCSEPVKNVILVVALLMCSPSWCFRVCLEATLEQMFHPVHHEF
jgi:hypothetical protein